MAQIANQVSYGYNNCHNVKLEKCFCFFGNLWDLA